MVRDKELLVFRSREKSNPNLYALPGTKKPINDNNLYGHEMDCADVFVALQKILKHKLFRWQKHWDKEERKFFGEKYGVWPDRVFEIDDNKQVFFLEVDRGTEDPYKQVWPKVQAYKKLTLQGIPGQAFTVLFTVQGYRYHDSANARLEELLPVLAKAQHSTQFLAALHEDFLANPLGDVFHSPESTTPLSILSL